MTETILAESESTYRRKLRAATRQLWFGILSQFEFSDKMLAAFRREFPLAYAEGARVCGIKPSEFTDDELRQIDNAISRELSWSIRLAQDVIILSIEHKRDRNVLFGQVYRRLEKWVNRYAEIRELGKINACSNRKMVWIYGDTIHCKDCAKYNGRVYRAKVWDKFGAVPKSRRLSCHGYNCQCRLEPTDLPITPGRPPAPTG